MKLTRPVELRGYEGFGMGGSERHLKRVCKGATVERGLSITGNRAALCDEVATKEVEVSLVATLHGTFCGSKR